MNFLILVCLSYFFTMNEGQLNYDSSFQCASHVCKNSSRNWPFTRTRSVGQSRVASRLFNQIKFSSFSGFPSASERLKPMDEATDINSVRGKTTPTF